MSSLPDSNKKRKTTEEAEQEESTNKTSPPEGYLCNLCHQPGHWIQLCPDRRKHNQKQKRQKKQHVPVPGVDPSPTDIQAAQKYQLWLVTNQAPSCFCGQPSRLKKVKKNKNKEEKQKQHSRAIGKYFFFCVKKREEKPCRFARLADEVIKENKRKGKKTNKAETPTKIEEHEDSQNEVEANETL